MGINQLPAEIEFTHDWYRTFLRYLLDEGYSFQRFSGQPEAGDVLLRHDVDLSLEDALTMAQIEAELDVRSTYCVLLTSALYNPLDPATADVLREIESLGHDIGLHFSTHAYWEGPTIPNETALHRRIRQEQATLESLVADSSTTVSFHRPDRWVLNKDFEAFQSTYAPEYFDEIAYVADSNQRWREDPPVLEDLPASMQILTHPGLWGGRDMDFESRVEQAVMGSCRHANRRAREEFLDGGDQ